MKKLLCFVRYFFLSFTGLFLAISPVSAFVSINKKAAAFQNVAPKTPTMFRIELVFESYDKFVSKSVVTCDLLKDCIGQIEISNNGNKAKYLYHIHKDADYLKFYFESNDFEDGLNPDVDYPASMIQKNDFSIDGNIFVSLYINKDLPNHLNDLTLRSVKPPLGTLKIKGYAIRQ